MHSPGMINSRCVTTPQSRIISDSRIQNNMFVCLNFTNAHTSLPNDNNEGVERKIFDSLRVTAGLALRTTDELVGGDAVFDEEFFANDVLKASNGEDFRVDSEDENGNTVSVVEKVYTSIIQPKYYAFASGEVEVNLIRLVVLRPEVSCTKGFFDNSDGKAACVPCPAGTYNILDKATHCLKCPVGTSTNGLTGQTECVACPPALPGWYI